MFASDRVLIALLAVILAAIVTATVRSIRDPIIVVADELVTTVPYVDADAEVASLLSTARGYDLRNPLPGTRTLTYVYQPGFAIVLAVATFPLGLLILYLSRTTLMLTVTVIPDGDHARIQVVGMSHRKVAMAVGKELKHRLMAGSDPRVMG